MLLVVVGYHLVLDGPHVLRCVFSIIRCYMQCIYVLGPTIAGAHRVSRANASGRVLEHGTSFFCSDFFLDNSV